MAHTHTTEQRFQLPRRGPLDGYTVLTVILRLTGCGAPPVSQQSARQTESQPVRQSLERQTVHQPADQLIITFKKVFQPLDRLSDPSAAVSLDFLSTLRNIYLNSAAQVSFNDTFKQFDQK